MNCNYCNTDHGDMDCDIDDIREYVDQLDRAVINESQTTH